MRRRDFMLQSSAAFFGAAISTRVFKSNKSKKMERPTFKTVLCDLLKIEYPILQAGMADVATPELAAAVSNSGGLGIITATMVAPETLRNNIRNLRDLTKKPFGVNLLLQQDLFPPREFQIADEDVRKAQAVLNGFRKKLDLPESFDKPGKIPPLIQKAFEIILEEKVPVFSIGLGNPTKEMVTLCKEKGILVMPMVCSIEDALEVEKSRVDIIVAQGSEAGGHRSTWKKTGDDGFASIGVLPLVSQLSSAVKVPVVAAGGIATGTDIVASILAGATGAMIGTRFAASTESSAPQCLKEKILKSSSNDTKVTDVFTGMYARVIRNDFTESYSKSGAPVLPPGAQLMLVMDILKKAGQSNNGEYFSLYSGQGIDHIHEIMPASEIMIRLIDEALSCLNKGVKRIHI